MDLDAGDSPWGDEPSRSVTTSATPKQDTQDNGAFCPWETSIAINPSLIAARSLLAAPAQPAPSVGSAEVRTPGRRVPRGTRKISAQATRLEAVDNTVDPLGPLGESTPDTIATPTEEAPAPPQKESLAARGPQPASTFAQIPGATGLAESVHLEEDGAGFRGPPPVQPAADVDGPKRQTQPSMSIEQAAKPTFDISVGDPHKVGDLTSSHIVYQVRTKTTSKGYRQPEFAVSRRYRDFLWLYNSLHNSNPGVVVAPPPEKQAVGRFDTNFVESRRAALERMLNKIAAHPILQHDGDLKIFLESEAFNVDIKNKENREPDLGQSKGMFSGFGISVGGGGKFVEHDDWFHDRKVYLDALENQLKALLKSMDTVVAQRKGLSEAAGDFSSSLHALAAVELSPALASPLDGLSELQFRIKELYERQAQQDVLTLGITIDEYIRLIGSVKTAFSQRQKAFHSWHAAESDLQKRKNTQEKLLRQGKSQQDRLNQANADVADAERKVHQTRLLFEDMGRLMRNELQRFEKEKVEDFKSGVETFLESAVEAQKELIELWETFLLRLDAGEDGLPYYVPESETGQAPVSESTTSAAEPAAATEDEDEA
ncbi:vacuolar protein sorting-associated protein vps5 [Penicillium ochrochloron]